MDHANDPAGRDPDKFRHGDGCSAPLAGHGGTPSARLETALPPTVFVSGLGDGALFLQGWPTGPHIYLNPDDAQPLKQLLEAVFADELTLSRDDQGWSL